MRARLHGSILVPKISAARLAVKTVLTMLEVSKPVDRTGQLFNQCLHQLAILDLWDAEDLVPVVPLPHRTAANLASVIGNLDSVRNGLGHLVIAHVLPIIEVDAHIKTITGILKTTANFLDAALRECQLGNVELHLLPEAEK